MPIVGRPEVTGARVPRERGPGQSVSRAETSAGPGARGQNDWRVVDELEPTTERLARRLERAGTSFLVEWLEGAVGHPQSPPGLEVRRFGGAVGFACPSRPELDFLNRVHDLWPEDAARVPEIARFYADVRVRAWFELAPSPDFERLAAALDAVGARQIGFLTMLYGHPRAAGTGNSRVVVEEVGGAGVETMVAALLRGYEVRAPDRGLHAHWAEVTNWRLFLARVDGEPAAAAALRLGDGIGYLATASTLPRFRGLGCQTALVAGRIEAASAAGCELVASQALLGSASQRNLERAGLRVAFTKAVWRIRA